MGGRFFSYMTLIEYETSLLYELLVQKCNDPRTRLLLICLYEDTKKHTSIMRSISQTLGQPYPPSMAECEVEMGSLYKESLDNIQSANKKLQNGMPLMEALKAALGHEKAVNEEYMTRLHLQVRSIKEKDEILRRILEDTAADEERHQELVKLAMGSLEREASH